MTEYQQAVYPVIVLFCAIGVTCFIATGILKILSYQACARVQRQAAEKNYAVQKAAFETTVNKVPQTNATPFPQPR